MKMQCLVPDAGVQALPSGTLPARAEWNNAGSLDGTNPGGGLGSCEPDYSLLQDLEAQWHRFQVQTS